MKREIERCRGCKGGLNNYAPKGELCGVCKGGLMLRLAKKRK